MNLIFVYHTHTHTHIHVHSPITDMSEVYENPYPARSYPGFHIFGFSWYVSIISLL